MQKLRKWLDALPGWRFTAALYVLRWLVIVPLSWLLSPFSSSQDMFRSEHGAAALLIPLLVVAPVVETLIECTFPYWLIYQALKRERRSPWPFVVVAALAMVALHPYTPLVMTFSFITGAFLAYVYFHFAEDGHGKAFLHTAVYHAAINLVGWTAILLSS